MTFVFFLLLLCFLKKASIIPNNVAIKRLLVPLLQDSVFGTVRLGGGSLNRDLGERASPPS